MVEHPPGVTSSERPPRARPTRSQVVRRRAIALTAVAVALGVFAWAGALALGRGSDDPPAAVTTAPPPPKPLRIIFPEGFTRTDMAQRIAEVNRIARAKRHVRPKLSPRAYLDLTARSPRARRFGGSREARTLEGFLFPATYEFLAKTTTKQLVAKQLEAFDRSWAKIDLRYARSKNLTPYDVLIIASMVEKETVAPEERALVAAVIYNRLRQGMKLEIDATIRYGLGVPATESLRKSQLETDNPYNTRTRPGLPPTPIANPGLASIQAAAHPANVDYLFFVRKPDKVHHFFTADGQEFLQYLAAHGYGG